MSSPLPVIRNRFTQNSPFLLAAAATALFVSAASSLPAAAQSSARRHTSSRRYGRRSEALPSRGGYDRSASLPRLNQQTLTGRVAVVVSDTAILRRDADPDSRVLSKVPKGTNLALVYEAGKYYGVTMIDSSVGWVAKSAVQMIDYQVQITPPPGSQLAETAAAVASGGMVTTGSGPQPGDIVADQGVATPTSAQAAAAMLPGNTSPRAVALIQEAFTYLGVPYVWGGETRRGLDCSAFVRSVFESQGFSLPRVAADQATVGQLVSWNDLQAGDRLYFDMGNKGRVSHTGLYLGNGYFIHASTNHGHVDVDSILKPNYYKALVCARRSF